MMTGFNTLVRKTAVKVEVAIRSSPSLTVRTVSVDVKQLTLNLNLSEHNNVFAKK